MSSNGHFSKMQDKELLHKLYWGENKSLREIGEIYGVSSARIWKWCKRLGIETREWSTKGMSFKGRKLSDEARRNISEAKKGMKLKPEHRKKVIKNLKNGKGEDHASWQGGKYIDESGYVFVYAPNSNLPTKSVYKLEHRLVMEKHLGRPLTTNEHIHHINGDKQDNRIENLKIVTNYEHAQIHWTDPQHIKEQSERIKKIRSEKFWSTKKPTS